MARQNPPSRSGAQMGTNWNACLTFMFKSLTFSQKPGEGEKMNYLTNICSDFLNIT